MTGHIYSGFDSRSCDKLKLIEIMSEYVIDTVIALMLCLGVILFLVALSFLVILLPYQAVACVAVGVMMINDATECEI